MTLDPPSPGLRDVSGHVVASVVAQARGARVEILRREAQDRISWRFRQPVPTLFWYRRGMDRCWLAVDGDRVESPISAASSLSFYPAGVEIDGSFSVDRCSDYTVVFLDPRTVDERKVALPDRPLVGFAHPPLLESFRQLTAEAERADDLFDLHVEGWTLQALAHLGRLARSSGQRVSPAGAAGLPARTLNDIDRFVADNLAARITISDLADVAGYSGRHLIRLFGRSVGQPPLRYVQSLRIDAAKRLLTTTDRSITSIAVECGFSRIHHFSSAFRIATGTSPSGYRGARGVRRGESCASRY